MGKGNRNKTVERPTTIGDHLHSLVTILRRRHSPSETKNRASSVLNLLEFACEADEVQLVDDPQLKALVPYLTGVNSIATQVVLEALEYLASGDAFGREQQISEIPELLAGICNCMRSGNADTALQAVNTLVRVAYAPEAAVNVMRGRPGVVETLTTYMISGAPEGSRRWRGGSGSSSSSYNSDLARTAARCARNLAEGITELQAPDHVSLLSAMLSQPNFLAASFALMCHKDTEVVVSVAHVVGALIRIPDGPSRVLEEPGSWEAVRQLLERATSALRDVKLPVEGLAADAVCDKCTWGASVFGDLHNVTKLALTAADKKGWAGHGEGGWDVFVVRDVFNEILVGLEDTRPFEDEGKLKVDVAGILGSWQTVLRFWCPRAEKARAERAGGLETDSGAEAVGGLRDEQVQLDQQPQQQQERQQKSSTPQQQQQQPQQQRPQQQHGLSGQLEVAGAGYSVRITRRCAVCRKTRADGAALRRCKGCGSLTGVRYCSDECCREHWVRHWHRKECEAAQKAIREAAAAEAAAMAPAATEVHPQGSGSAA